jgi:hypothetical protein
LKAIIASGEALTFANVAALPAMNRCVNGCPFRPSQFRDLMADQGSKDSEA